MAIALEDKENVQAPSAAYPQGRIKDNPGDGTGTPVDEPVYGDFHQFFARLLVEAGVIPNGVSENAYDGFQYIEALQKFNPAFITTGISYGASMSAINNFGFRIKNGKVELRGGISKGGAMTTAEILFTLPVGYRPSFQCAIPVGSYSFLTGPGWQITISTAGVVSIYEHNTSSGAIGIANLNLEGVSFSL